MDKSAPPLGYAVCRGFHYQGVANRDPTARMKTGEAAPHNMNDFGYWLRTSRRSAQAATWFATDRRVRFTDVSVRFPVRQPCARDATNRGEAARDGAVFEGLDEVAAIDGEDGRNGEDFRGARGRGPGKPLLCGSGCGRQAAGAVCSGHSLGN